MRLSRPFPLIHHTEGAPIDEGARGHTVLAHFVGVLRTLRDLHWREEAHARLVVQTPPWITSLPVVGRAHCLQRRCSVSSSAPSVAAQMFQVPQYGVCLEVLGKQVRGVIGRAHLLDLQGAVSDMRLDPQVLYIYVPGLAQALSVYHTNSRRRVCAYYAIGANAKVSKHAHDTVRLGGSL